MILGLLLYLRLLVERVTVSGGVVLGSDRENSNWDAIDHFLIYCGAFLMLSFRKTRFL